MQFKSDLSQSVRVSKACSGTLGKCWMRARSTLHVDHIQGICTVQHAARWVEAHTALVRQCWMKVARASILAAGAN